MVYTLDNLAREIRFERWVLMSSDVHIGRLLVNISL
jgi:hypothetical protein